MIDVLNLQRKVKIENDLFRTYSKLLISEISEANQRQFSIAFVSDSRMKQLNQFFRGKNSTTDVLSFPYEADEFQSKSYAFTRENDEDDSSTNITAEAVTLTTDFIGDIVISAEQAERQAKENNLSLENEIKQLILHGLLHLCGYDHETDNGEMNARELELRDKLGI